jgi:hypothetical protein
MNGSMGQTVTSGRAHNISSAEEKLNALKSERSMDDDLCLLSIRSVSSAVGRTRIRTLTRVSSEKVGPIWFCSQSEEFRIDR